MIETVPEWHSSKEYKDEEKRIDDDYKSKKTKAKGKADKDYVKYRKEEYEKQGLDLESLIISLLEQKVIDGVDTNSVIAQKELVRQQIKTDWV